MNGRRDWISLGPSFAQVTPETGMDSALTAAMKVIGRLKSIYSILLSIALTMSMPNSAWAATKPSPWFVGATCSAVLSGALFIGPSLVDNHMSVSKTIEQYQSLAQLASARETAFQSFFSKTIGPVIMGPLLDLFGVLGYRIAGYNIPNSFLAQIGRLGVYTSVVFGAKGIARAFFEIPQETFLEKTEARMQPNPERVLFLDLINSKNDVLFGQPETVFNRLYSQHADAHFINFVSLADLKAQLEKFKGRPFDRIEIWGHGSPGSMSANDSNDKTIEDKDFAQFFKDLGFSLSHGSTDLRFNACSLLNGQETRRSQIKPPLKELITGILPMGGKVYGTSKNIGVFSFIFDPKLFQSNYALQIGLTSMSYLAGIESFHLFLQQLSSLDRNYWDALNYTIVFEVESSGQIRRIEK